MRRLIRSFLHCSYLPIAYFIKYFLLKLSQDKWRDMGLNKYMVNTSHPFFFFLSLLEQKTINAYQYFYFRLKRVKIKMACIALLLK